MNDKPILTDAAELAEFKRLLDLATVARDKAEAERDNLLKCNRMLEAAQRLNGTTIAEMRAERDALRVCVSRVSDYDNMALALEAERFKVAALKEQLRIAFDPDHAVLLVQENEKLKAERDKYFNTLAGALHSGLFDTVTVKELREPGEKLAAERDALKADRQKLIDLMNRAALEAGHDGYDESTELWRSVASHLDRFKDAAQAKIAALKDQLQLVKQELAAQVASNRIYQDAADKLVAERDEARKLIAALVEKVRALEKRLDATAPGTHQAPDPAPQSEQSAP